MASIIFEVAMILLFGLSWPFNVIKSLRSRTAKGKSLMFLLIIFAGYICGIISKLVLAEWGDFFTIWIHYLLFSFYCINLIMVGTDIMLYLRNRKLDKINNTITF